VIDPGEGSLSRALSTATPISSTAVLRSSASASGSQKPGRFYSQDTRQGRRMTKGEWILNGDWDQQQFDPPELPGGNGIDAVTPITPSASTATTATWSWRIPWPWRWPESRPRRLSPRAGRFSRIRDRRAHRDPEDPHGARHRHIPAQIWNPR